MRTCVSAARPVSRHRGSAWHAVFMRYRQWSERGWQAGHPGACQYNYFFFLFRRVRINIFFTFLFSFISFFFFLLPVHKETTNCRIKEIKEKRADKMKKQKNECHWELEREDHSCGWFYWRHHHHHHHHHCEHNHRRHRRHYNTPDWFRFFSILLLPLFLFVLLLLLFESFAHLLHVVFFTFQKRNNKKSFVVAFF